MERQIDRRKKRLIEKRKDRLTDKKIDSEKERNKNRPATAKINWQIKSQTDRKKDIWTDALNKNPRIRKKNSKKEQKG